MCRRTLMRSHHLHTTTLQACYCRQTSIHSTTSTRFAMKIPSYMRWGGSDPSHRFNPRRLLERLGRSHKVCPRGYLPLANQGTFFFCITSIGRSACSMISIYGNSASTNQPFTETNVTSTPISQLVKNFLDVGSSTSMDDSPNGTADLISQPKHYESIMQAWSVGTKWTWPQCVSKAVFRRRPPSTCILPTYTSILYCAYIQTARKRPHWGDIPT